MKIGLLFNQLPLWLLYVTTVVIVFLAVVIGFRWGSQIRRHKKSETEAPIGTIVGAMLGLLAFILAFSFGIAASRFDVRKQLLLDEVNGIGTAFLRADFLPASQRAEARMLFRKYVDIRVEATQHLEKLPQVLVDSVTLHDQLWSQVSGLSGQYKDSVLFGLYTQALNDVIDLHTKRATVVFQYRVPKSIWLALYFLTILSMAAVGYHFGISGAGNLWIILLLALGFSAIIALIADLDRPLEGLLKVNQKPMIELQQQLSPPAK
jgi:hypothetical protein